MSEPFRFSQSLQVDFLNDLYDGDWEYAESVFENVITGDSKTDGACQPGIRNANAEGLRQALHKAKPLFGYVGLPATQAMIQHMENNCKTGVLNGAMKEDFANLKNKIRVDSDLLEEEFRRLTEYNKK
jgi:hypothetical protein